MDRTLSRCHPAIVPGCASAAALAILVLIEKVLPLGQWVSYGVGVALIGWGVATLLV